MKTLRAIHYEFERGFRTNALVLIGLAAFLLIAQLSFVARLLFDFDSSASALESAGTFSTGDLLACLNQGMKPFDPSTKRFFILDMVWAAPYLALGYLSCIALSKHAKRESYLVAPRMGSRTVWVFSRIAYLIALVFLYVITEFGIALALTATFGGTLSLAPTPWIEQAYGFAYSHVDSLSISVSYLAIIFALLAFALAIATVSFFAPPAIAFLVALIYIIASAYFSTPWLFLGGSMIVRSPLATGDVAVSATTIFQCGGILICCFIINLIVPRRMDLL